MRVDVSQLPEKYQKQVEKQIQDEQESAAALLPTPVTLNKANIKLEKELQSICENWLHLRGYYRMTGDNAERQHQINNPDCIGWFGHLYNAKKNPLMPDIFCFNFRGGCLLIELKTAEVYQPGQKEMIEMGLWKLAFSFDEFKYEVELWERR